MKATRTAAIPLTAALGASALTAIAAAPASADISNGLIAYEKYVDYTDPEGFPRSAHDIFTKTVDGLDELNITSSDAVDDIQPAWSADGTRIAFSSNADGNYDIYTMAADGSDVRQVTFTFGIEYEGGYIDYFSSFEPTWSPDGTQIAFTGYRGGITQAEVFIVPVEATPETYAETRVTDGADFMSSSTADWSSDGTKLAYTQGFDSYTTDIWTINTDGTGAVNLTSEAGVYVSDGDPSWSLDGTRITWVSNRAATDPLGIETDVYVMQADGTGVVAATTDTVVEYDPEFSPDGTEILYQRNFYNPEIWVVAAPAVPPPPGVEGKAAAVDATPVKIGSGGAPTWQPVEVTTPPPPGCTIVGTEGNDTLTGTNGVDVICGLGGDDVITAKAGKDTLVGGAGNDTLYGGAGNDKVKGGKGDDIRDGGTGNDSCDATKDSAPAVNCEK